MIELAKERKSAHAIARRTGWSVDVIRRVCKHQLREALAAKKEAGLWVEDRTPRPLMPERQIAALYAGQRYQDDPAAVRDARCTRPIFVRAEAPGLFASSLVTP